MNSEVADPKITLVSTFKDEGPYILDWIAHYKALGVQDFLIFTNDCTDPTDHILRVLNQKGIIQHRFNRVMRRGPHKSALMWAMYEPVVRDADWVFVADVDEFLFLSEDVGTLPALLRKLGDVDAISFIWRLFGNGGIEQLTDTPVPAQFLLAEPYAPAEGERRMFKTMHCNNGKFSRLGVHRPFLSGDAKDVRWVLPDGTAFTEKEVEKGLRRKGPFGYEVAQLNHYALRSVDGFINKKARGRANHQTDTIESDYWHRFDKNDETDRRLAERFEAAEAIKQTWLEDAILKAHHDEALELHQRRARRARKKPETQKLLQHIGVTPVSSDAETA